MIRLSFVEVFAFTRRVARRFVLHHGLLLASAIAFDSLLSAVPLLALSLVLLSLVLDPSAVATLISLQLESMLPGAIEPVIRAYATFLERREAAGSLGAVGLLVFGTMAFRTIRDAIAIIFDGSMVRRPRSWLRMLVPFAYVGVMGAGIFLGTLLMIGLDALPSDGIEVFGRRFAVQEALRYLGKTFTFLLILALFTSFYHLLPAKRPDLPLALVGGVVAASLWELVRRLLVFYFANVSVVGAVYGSLASIIVLLSTFEAGALVLLLGAQVVAEIQRSLTSGLPWHADPDKHA